MLRRSRLRLVATAVVLLAGCGPRDLRNSDPPEPPLSVLYDAADEAKQTPARALEIWSELAEQWPMSPGVGRGLQDARRARLGEERYIALYQQATRERPDDPLAWYLYGRARIDQPEEARGAFDKALELDPDLAWAAIGRAYVNYQRGDVFQTVREHEQAVARMPRSATLRWRTASLYLELKLYVQALRHIEVAVRLAPDDPLIVAARGQTAYGLGRYDEALVWLERAGALEPRQPEIYQTLAALYLRADRPQDADAAYRRGLTLGLQADDELAFDIRAALLIAGLSD